MNDAKSAPFAYIVKAKNPISPPPKVVKKPTFWQLMQNSPTHTAKHVKLAQFTLISKIPCSLGKRANLTANYTKSAPFTNPYSESCGISQIRAIFNYFSIFAFRHS